MIAILQNGHRRIGGVKDVSTGGLSFEHINDEIRSHDSLKTDILLLADGSNMLRLPCRVVYDTVARIPGEIQFLPVHFPPRRCGVEFKDLSENQQVQVELFIKNYTIGMS